MSTDAVNAPLFVPALKLPRLNLARVDSADLLIVDLEDAVSESEKDNARGLLRKFLETSPHSQIAVRINSTGSPHFYADISVCEMYSKIRAVMLPKVECASDCKKLTRLDIPIIALIETTRGLMNLYRVCEQPNVSHLALGTIDLSLSAGLAEGSAEEEFFLNQARVQIVSASGAYSLNPPLDGVYPTLQNDEGLHRHTHRARSFGFGGVMCIHPSQIGIVKAVFRPSDEEVYWARRIVSAMQQNKGVATMEGKMIDAPVLARATRILASIDEAPSA